MQTGGSLTTPFVYRRPIIIGFICNRQSIPIDIEKTGPIEKTVLDIFVIAYIAYINSIKTLVIMFRLVSSKELVITGINNI